MQETALQLWGECAPAWRRWQQEFTAQYRSVTELGRCAARLGLGAHVLDLACATGDLSLALAARVGSSGRVAALDLTAGMLVGAAQRLRGAAMSNVDLYQADAQALPFADGLFDAVVCRLAITLFPDPLRALRECRRVLRPGGRLVVLAWGPPRGDTLLMVRTVLAHHAAPEAAHALPDPLRFARGGALTAALRAAGFGAVEESEHLLPFPWPGPPECAWQGMYELQPAVRRLYAAVAPAERAGVRRRILQTIAPFYDGRRVNFTGVIMLGTGER